MNLSEIIETQYQPEILSFFLLAPNRAFCLQELITRLGIKADKLEPVLKEMEKSGGIKHFTARGNKYFILKQNFKPFPELKKALVKGKLQYEDELFTSIKKLPGIKAAYLSGIFVGQPELPVDILFVGKLSSEHIESFIKSCEKMICSEVNYSVLQENEFVLRRNTFDRFLKDVFDYHNLPVLELQTKK